jgi:pimeloyl-ACP methyl ester carboxylesterase
VNDIRVRVLLVLFATACSSDANDPINDVPYPTCSSPTEQCLDRIDVGSGLAMPIYRNVSLSVPNANITEGVVVVHGSSRDANNFFYSVITAAAEAGIDASTAVIAPHFQCGGDSPPSGDVYWQCSGDDWSHGYADANGAMPSIYSYAVMDAIVSALANKNTFPNLTRIVVTGLSAGGQFTQRYAATNAIDPMAGAPVRYVVLSPSSYVYMDANRPAPTAGCADYDDYYYGLENRSGYVGIPSVQTIRQQYVARDLVYFVGSEDTLANAAGTDLDTSCEANTQGADRVARATSFVSTMQKTYDAEGTLTIVPGCMHSRTCMYFSPQVRQALFGAAQDM